MAYIRLSPTNFLSRQVQTGGAGLLLLDGTITEIDTNLLQADFLYWSFFRKRCESP
jgi:hypothetical protein